VGEKERLEGDGGVNGRPSRGTSLAEEPVYAYEAMGQLEKDVLEQDLRFLFEYYRERWVVGKDGVQDRRG
jgi:hypothetical protein